MKRLAYGMLLLVVLSLLISGCTSYDTNELIEQPQRKIKTLQTLRLQLSDNLMTLDPAFVSTLEERQISRLLFSGLLSLDEKMKIKGDIAKDWTISEDGKTYTFTLNKKARFHNNVIIKASDFKFSWQRIVFENSPEKYIFSNVVGYWEFISGRSTEISGIKVIDDFTLTVNLTTPENTFLMSLCNPAAAVVDRYQVIARATQFGKVGTMDKPTEPLNGSGKFKLYEWVNHERLTLGKNYNYFTTKPRIERLEILFESEKEAAINDYNLGDLDCALDILPEDMKSDPKIKGKTTTLPLMQIYYLRLEPAVIGDIRVRQALLNSIDFKKMGLSINNDSLTNFTNITTYLAEGPNINATNSVVFDTYSASQLLTQAGYPAGQGLLLNLYYLKTSGLKDTALSLVAQWGARGIKVQALPITKEELRTLKLSKSAGIYIDEWNAAVPDLVGFFYPQFSSTFGNGVSNETDKLINEALLASDTNQENLKFSAVEKNLKDNYIIQPLFYKSMTLVSKPRVKGLELNKLGVLSLDKITLSRD